MIVAKSAFAPSVTIETELPAGVYEALKAHIEATPGTSQDDVIAVAICLYLSMNARRAA